MTHFCPCCRRPTGATGYDSGVCCHQCFHALSISWRWNDVHCNLHHRRVRIPDQRMGGYRGGYNG